MQLLTINEAAELTNKSIQTIRRMIKQKKIQVKRKKTPQGFNYLIVKDTLLEYLAQFASTTNQQVPAIPETTREHRPIENRQDDVLLDQLKGLNMTIQKLAEQNQKDKENFFGLIKTFQDRIFSLENHIKQLEAPKSWWKLW